MSYKPFWSNGKGRVKDTCRLFVSAVALSLAVACRPVKLFAQSEPAYPNTVIEVRVSGNKVISDAGVLVNVKTRPGQPYAERVVQGDVRRLLESGRFFPVQAVKTQTDKGVIVTFKLQERALVAAVEFSGNKTLKEKELRAVLTFGEQDPIVRFQIDRGAEAIESKYRSAGHNFVKVTLDESALRDRQQVVYTIVEGQKISLRKIRFEGNQAFGARRLRGRISSRARFWPFLAGVLDSEAVEGDVAALREFYRSEGYLNSRVDRLLKFSSDKRRAELTFIIDEGGRHRIRRTVFQGNTVFAGAEVRRYLKLTRGSFYNALALRRDLKKVESLYGEIGFIDMQVSAREVYPGPDEPAPDWLELAPGEEPALVDLVYTIAEGPQIRVGRIDIRGNTVTKMNVIRRQLQFRPGQLYNTVAVEQTHNRLRETGLFDKVSIAPFGEDPGVRNVLVEIEEGKTAQFLIGAGVSSNAGLLGNVSFRERNFDISAWPRSWEDFKRGRAFKGGGQTFSITAEPGVDFMRFRVDWHEPYLLDRPISLGTRAFVFTSGRETYDETRYGGLLSVGHRFKNRWYGELAWRIEGIRADNLDNTKAPPDVRDVAGTTALTGLKGTLVRDDTDSRWLPSKGSRLILNYEHVMGDFNFGRGVADYHIYRTIHLDALDRKHILAGRASAGAVLGNAPVFERFYGGGLGSLRGFDYRGMGPRQGRFDQVVGGDFTMFAGAEYTFPLAGRHLRGVIFLDSGTIERDIEIRDYRASAGFGIRIYVPFFGPVPMNLDFAFPLKKTSEDNTQLISFSFGWVF